jgi:hypothetical protein
MDTSRQEENNEAIWQGKFAVLSLKLVEANHNQHHLPEKGPSDHHHPQNRQQATCAATASAARSPYPKMPLEEPVPLGGMATESRRRQAVQDLPRALLRQQQAREQMAAQHRCYKQKESS